MNDESIVGPVLITSKSNNTINTLIILLLQSSTIQKAVKML